MSVEQCIAEIQNAVGRELRPEELDRLEQEVSAKVRHLRGTDVDDLDTALAQAMEERANEIEMTAFIEKRNALLNARAKARMLDYVRGQWSDDPGIGLRAFVGGVASTRQGSRNSVAWAQESLAGHYLRGLLTELDQAGLLRAAKSGEYDRAIFQARYAQARGDQETLNSLPQEAVRIADIRRRYQEKARKDANDAGAWIGELEEYVGRQGYDPYRVREVEEDYFMRKMEERIDWQRTFPDIQDGEGRRQALRRLYSDIISGVHMAQNADGPQTHLRGFANIGRQMSQERMIHFKDADAAFEHMQEFGYRRLLDTDIQQLDIMAQNTALMRMMGPNAEKNFDDIVDHIRRTDLRDADPRVRQRFENKVERGPLSIKRTIMPNLTGQSRKPGHHTFARRSLMVRQLQQMALLGMSVVSAVTDVPFYGMEVAYNGGNFFSGMAEALGGLVRGGRSNEQSRIISQLGVIADGMKGTTLSRFDTSEDIPGKLTGLTNLYFKANFLQPWTDNLRDNFALARAHDMWNQKGLRFDELPSEEQRVLGLYNIDANKWDLYRRQQGDSDGSRSFLTPEGIDDLGDDAIIEFLQAQGRQTSNRAIREAREEIKDNFRSYFADRASFASLTPDDRTRGVLLQGTQPGTVTGELLRHVALFKSFPTSVLMKPMAREWHGRGNLRGMDATFNDSPMANLANMIVWNTAFGYLAMNAKEMARGRTPRVPENADEFRDTFFAAMVQGGGMGIFGDFLFGEVKNRFGGTFVTTLAGPTAGTVDDLMNLYGRAREGDDTAATALRTIVNNTPGANLPYVRTALDYAILYRLQEWADPGSLRRMEDHMAEEAGNEYFHRASDYVPRGGF